MPAMLPPSYRASSCLPVQTADPLPKERGGGMRSLVLFSKKPVYKMCPFSLTELNFLRCRAFVSHMFVALPKCFHAFDQPQCPNDDGSLYNSYPMLCLLYSREKAASQRHSQAQNNHWCHFAAVSNITSRMHLACWFWWRDVLSHGP